MYAAYSTQSALFQLVAGPVRMHTAKMPALFCDCVSALAAGMPSEPISHVPADFRLAADVHPMRQHPSYGEAYASALRYSELHSRAGPYPGLSTARHDGAAASPHVSLDSPAHASALPNASSHPTYAHTLPAAGGWLPSNGHAGISGNTYLLNSVLPIYPSIAWSHGLPHDASPFRPSPTYSPHSPPYIPSSPVYSPTSPSYWPSSPAYRPQSDQHASPSVAIRPNASVNHATSLEDSAVTVECQTPAGELQPAYHILVAAWLQVLTIYPFALPMYHIMRHALRMQSDMVAPMHATALLCTVASCQ